MMKNVILALVLAAASSSVMAAMPVTSSAAQGLQKIGEVSSQATTLSSFEQMIAADAKQRGASAYRITSVTVNNHVYGTADLYK
ncbi:Multiple stress resistance protein BhsA precursor [Serratia fonticola]|uniref:Multiple stress resistance protein BhsA n=2 Tax=Serratia fonticola TaxID=47917 RepID=A0A4U9W4H9_SERFO|nr:Multiple stress resistance protein BhsA precursor [Serratia fonticola]VTR53637.1 Multiple stress resistance protein BhsA precursor [Serratia fonticola]